MKRELFGLLFEFFADWRVEFSRWGNVYKALIAFYRRRLSWNRINGHYSSPNKISPKNAPRQSLQKKHAINCVELKITQQLQQKTYSRKNVSLFLSQITNEIINYNTQQLCLCVLCKTEAVAGTGQSKYDSNKAINLYRDTSSINIWLFRIIYAHKVE